MKRRRVLTTLGVSSISLAGCIGEGMPSDAIVRAVQQGASEDVEVVSYDDLPQAEQQIALTAIEEGFYHACPELPDAIRSFAYRFETEYAYLEYQDTTYALYIRIEDQVYSEAVSPPENEPSCGFSD